MADPDPFNDPIFVTRLQKLMALLASEQPGEAEAARRKLLEHLTHHRLTLNDVVQRLPHVTAAPRASFMQGAIDMSLERQLQIARVARQEAEGDVQRATVRLAEMQKALYAATFDAERALNAQGRTRVIAAIGWILAATVSAAFIAARLHEQGMAQGAAEALAGNRVLQVDPSAGAGNPLRMQPGERLGTVLVQDLAVRLSPSEDASIRAFLNRGMRVVVEQQVRVGPQAWLLIRSQTGSGWVPGGGVQR